MKNAVIIGANRGIGLELTRQLADNGWRARAVCRQSSTKLQALDVEVVDGVDVTDAASLERLASALGPDSTDLLINNAGVMHPVSIDTLDSQAIRRQFEVNALGPLLVVHALLPALRNPAKLALISSRMGSIADNDSGGSYGYRMSKAALNAAGKSLAHDLAERGISVALLHPGYVRTDMTGNRGLIDVDEAASGLLARIDALSLETSGTFWHSNGEVLPW
ncbi:SDR family oxidoreductase [Chromatocurvus halotolerans]|uniref:Short-subunit dehydrogenase n=1 Tax=Chromatocurvus halotolerans TaxID=1132028 RepID=A0A4R2KP70_9GAMM|nr:SDR family oxidoreductase [Chromatocurvus halotolerans]TCO75513.1 short-subunit dehydrogenase [Chromatocurvus halotolerans]